MSADIHGLSGAYAVDALDTDERAAFEQHLAQCAECQAEVASLREAAAGLAALSETAPPPELRRAVLAGIKTVRPLPPAVPVVEATAAPQVVAPSSGGDGIPGADTSPEGDHPLSDDALGGGDVLPGDAQPSADVVPLAPRRRPKVWLVAAAAAVVLALGGIVWNANRHEPSPTYTATEQVVHASDAQRYEKSIDGVRATIIRSPSLHKAVIVADNMPAAPAGKDYQLWLNYPGKGMVSAGLMPHGAKPTVTVLLDGDAAKATAAGITVEPAGGSKAPTSNPIALFTFS
jgi:anti-sigma-K factor RskA